MNTENTIENTVENTAAAGPVIGNTPWIQLIPETNYAAVLTSIEADVNANGNEFLVFHFDTDHGKHVMRQFVGTPKSIEFVEDQLEKAFGITDIADAEQAIGQQCTVRTKINSFNGKDRVVIGFINRYNPNAGKSFSFADLKAKKNQPETPAEEVNF